MLIVLLLLGMMQFVVNPLLLWLSAKVLRVPNVGLLRAYGAYGLLLVLSLIGLGLTLWLRLLPGPAFPILLILGVLELAVDIWLVQTIFRTTFGRAIGCYSFTIVTAVALALGIRAVAVEAFLVPTASMEQAILRGDHILADKVSLRFREPRRGEVIVFHSPDAYGTNGVKRVIGVPGDRLELSGDVLSVNGRPAGECVLFKMPEYESTAVKFPAVVPPGKLFVLGDNRSRSKDSRFWGFADVKAVVGLAVMVYASVDEPEPAYLDGAKPSDVHTGRRIRWGRIGTAIR